MTSAPFQPPDTSVPARGSVHRTFIDARALTGFMDEGHFGQFAQEYLASLDESARSEVLAAASEARAFVQTLQPISLEDALSRPLTSDYTTAVASHPTFQAAFRDRPHAFVWVRPEKLIALQVWVKPRADAIPTDESNLIRLAVPDRWDVPAEISFIPPQGPIYVMTSAPHLAGIDTRLEAEAGRIIIEPRQHINILQVMRFSNRYYVRNGYHRVFDALSAGLTEIPALLVDALQPNDLIINLGNEGFNHGFVMGLPRPPLIADFLTPASQLVKMRLRRYGVAVYLQTVPVNLGI